MEKNKISTLQRSMVILEYLADHGTASASELIENSGIPKSTAYLLLKEMLQLRLISQDNRGHYRLWVRLIALGERASEQLDIRETSRPHLERLMETTGLLCHFGIFDGDTAYYILKIESQGSISVRSYVGKRLSLYRSGLGKCLLAWQPEDMRENIISNTVFERATPTTIVTPEALREELTLIRTQGWGFDNSEDEPSVRCVAAPVFDARAHIAGAISVVGTSMQVSDAVVPVLKEQVMACAREISRDLGWTER
ncbi:IclR family transcriptional regulator [Maridesulfovibrio zosterae]|uniref:IclR family transcriptional regulator n=1 Tax=Maridesulfovibrio zosterae TaxID=82171 RepID=UPI00042833FF|nr:IclR family transcriptional regulator [Maridesulfovibrio zosterae]